MLEFIKNLFKSNSTSDSTRQEGTVKFFNGTKGFGFIKVNDTGDEIFVHKSDVIDRIRDKDKVTFVIEHEEKGPKAVEVRKVK
ncbi:MAG: cold-shock protein [Aquaticitalea sp.]